jgi:hypothetical protein
MALERAPEVRLTSEALPAEARLADARLPPEARPALLAAVAPPRFELLALLDAFGIARFIFELFLARFADFLARFADFLAVRRAVGREREVFFLAMRPILTEVRPASIEQSDVNPSHRAG